MTVCVGVYKGGKVKMETDKYFMGLLIWWKKWERDERSSKRTEFFYVFNGGGTSTSRPASESWGDSDISLSLLAGPCPRPSTLRAEAQLKRGAAWEERGGRGNQSAIAAPEPHRARRG